MNEQFDAQHIDARFIKTDQAEAANRDGTIGIVDRHWYMVHGLDEHVGVEFAITSDNRLLDSDGKPVNESDPEAIEVRKAITVSDVLA